MKTNRRSARTSCARYVDDARGRARVAIARHYSSNRRGRSMRSFPQRRPERKLSCHSRFRNAHCKLAGVVFFIATRVFREQRINYWAPCPCCFYSCVFFFSKFLFVFCSVDRRDSTERLVAVGAARRGAVPQEIHAINGRPRRPRARPRRPVRLVRPAAPSSLPQVSPGALHRRSQRRRLSRRRH